MKNENETNNENKEVKEDYLTFENNPDVKIKPSDIVCVFCLEPHLFILLKSGKVEKVKERLKNLLLRLDKRKFYKPHKSYIISLKRAQRYLIYGRGLLVEMEIEIAKNNIKFIHVPVAKRVSESFKVRVSRIAAITHVVMPRCPVHVFKGSPII